MSIPMNNLKEPHFEPSSLQPGCSGESENAPYGPKACEYETIESLKAFGETFEKNEKVSGFEVGRTSGPAKKSFPDTNP